ncbi:MAG: hypothetical protein ABI347_01225 [Nitrososphaera sp.]|jgi:hypothetical protein
MGRITDDYEGKIETKIVNATDHYFIYSEFRNPAEQPVNLTRVFYVVNVIDDEGYSQFVDGNNYGNHTISSYSTHGYQVHWQPLLPGNYTIITFLVSDWDTPQPLSTATSFRINVGEKVDVLGEGDSNNRLQVESINVVDNTVTIAYDYCDERIPYQHSTTAVLHPGNHVPINSVDAYLTDIRGKEAVFRFVSNGGTDICLI